MQTIISSMTCCMVDSKMHCYSQGKTEEKRWEWMGLEGWWSQQGRIVSRVVLS